MSFSVVGMALLFGLGGIIIFISLTVDTIVGWLQVRLSKGLHARTEWLLNDKLQLQRLQHEEMRLGNWDDSKSVPVTIQKDKFLGPAYRHLTVTLRKNGSSEEEGAGVQLVQEQFDVKQDGSHY